MDYSKHYFLLMQKAKNRELISGVEKHHIIPKSLGGLNDKSNLVKLTYREHYVAHRLLSKMFDHDKAAKAKMIYAIWVLSRRLKTEKIKISSREFAIHRENYSKYHPQKDESIKAKIKENRSLGLYKYDYDKVGKSLKETLSKMSAEELSIRAKNSGAKCDQIAKGQSIQKGKASLIKATYENGTAVEFFSYEAKAKFGIDYPTIKRYIKTKNGFDNNKVHYEIIKRYNGGNKWTTKL